jgi:hypothetical protein
MFLPPRANLFGLLAVGLLAAGPAWALEVKSQLWGFDGAVAHGHPAPLSLLIENPTDTAFDGTIMLRRGGNIGRGERFVRTAYIGPLSQRWVQFAPFCGDSSDWTLSWGPGPNQRASIRGPRFNRPATVFMLDPQQLSPAPRVPAFRANLFPPSVCLTSSLGAAVLDHVPTWSPLQQTAFAEWLQAGGTVHLVPGIDGTTPVFPERLSALNSPQQSVRVGAGRVIRHARNRRTLTPAALADAGFALPSLAAQPQHIDDDIIRDSLHRRMRGLVSTDHNWAVIYSLIVIYMVLIGPVNFLLGRRWQDYRLTLGFFVLTVAGFAVLFSIIGRRGYGERAIVHSIAYARPVSPGVFDVARWGNIFVTSGDDYELSYGTAGGYFSAASGYGVVGSRVQNGKDGKLAIAIPLFSSKSFVHRGRLPGPEAKVHLKSSQLLGNREELVVGVEGLDVRAVWMLHRDGLIAMGAHGGDWRVEAPPSRWQKRTVDMSEWQWNQANMGQSETAPETLSREVVSGIIGRAFGAVPSHQIALLTDPDPNRFDVFVLAPSPATFAHTSTDLGEAVGFTFFHYQLYRDSPP